MARHDRTQRARERADAIALGLLRRLHPGLNDNQTLLASSDRERNWAAAEAIRMISRADRRALKYDEAPLHGYGSLTIPKGKPQ